MTHRVDTLQGTIWFEVVDKVKGEHERKYKGSCNGSCQNSPEGKSKILPLDRSKAIKPIKLKQHLISHGYPNSEELTLWKPSTNCGTICCITVPVLGNTHNNPHVLPDTDSSIQAPLENTGQSLNQQNVSPVMSDEVRGYYFPCSDDSFDSDYLELPYDTDHSDSSFSDTNLTPCSNTDHSASSCSDMNFSSTLPCSKGYRHQETKQTDVPKDACTYDWKEIFTQEMIDGLDLKDPIPQQTAPPPVPAPALLRTFPQASANTTTSTTRFTTAQKQNPNVLRRVSHSKPSNSYREKHIPKYCRRCRKHSRDSCRCRRCFECNSECHLFLKCPKVLERKSKRARKIQN